MSHPALEYLDTAEATIMSWWQRVEADEEAEVDFSSMLAAVLRSISRAAGLIEADNLRGKVLPLADRGEGGV